MNTIEQKQFLYEHADEAIAGTVNDMINEQLPGIEGRSREELEAIVRRHHLSTIEEFLAGRIAAQDATRHTWLQVARELSTL